MINMCRVLQKKHQVFVLLGGEVPERHFEGIPYRSLIYIDEISIWKDRRAAEETMRQRFLQMKEVVEEFHPDILFVDYFPF